MFYFFFHTKCFKSKCPGCTYKTSQFKFATLKEHYSHMWLLGTVLKRSWAQSWNQVLDLTDYWVVLLPRTRPLTAYFLDFLIWKEETHFSYCQRKFPVWGAEKERLYSGEQVTNQGNSLGRNQKCSTENKGRPPLTKLPPWFPIGPFYANKESK